MGETLKFYVLRVLLSLLNRFYTLTTNDSLGKLTAKIPYTYSIQFSCGSHPFFAPNDIMNDSSPILEQRRATHMLLNTWPVFNQQFRCFETLKWRYSQKKLAYSRNACDIEIYWASLCPECTNLE